MKQRLLRSGNDYSAIEGPWPACSGGESDLARVRHGARWCTMMHHPRARCAKQVAAELDSVAKLAVK